MNRENSDNNALYFLSGGGEMGALIRATDWSKTPLGAPTQWPQSLKTMVAVMLDNPFGMYIAWGKEYTQLYNDGYRPILGANKHPQALGISTRQTFSEIWHIIGSMFDGVMAGTPVGFPDFMLPLNRNGFVEDCYFDFSYSPIRQEDGSVGGVLVTVIETTEKKKAVDALLESERRFRTMADNIPNLAFMANADGYIYWYNQKWFDYTGTTPDEMEGWGWQKVHNPDILPIVIEQWQQSINTGRPFEMTFPLRGADGSFRQFLTRVQPVLDSEGKVYQWFGTNTDVTEQMEAEQSIKESEERFRVMAEDSEILIATSDETGNATYFNSAWTEFTGRDLNELLNFGWADLIHEEDREPFVSLYLRSFAEQQDWTGEFRMKNKAGEYRWLLANGPARFRPDGSFAGYISSSVDITDRKTAERAIRESEQNLRNTIIQAPVAMCLFDGPQHVVSLANTKMFELWGRDGASILGRPIFEGLPEAKDQGFEELLNGVYETGNAYSAEGVPVRLPRNNKVETVYVNFVYAPHREPDGRVSGILAVAIDATAQVMARQKIEEVVNERTAELADANQNLQKSNAELAQFAYIASHDLQEPLRKISTFSQMLERTIGEPSDERAKHYLDKIKSASARMTTLIRDVLAYSELDKQKDLFAKVNLNEVVDGILKDYDLLIEEKGAEVTCEKLPEIVAIPLQMAQLFSNLIGNALKFAKKDAKPLINITAELVGENDSGGAQLATQAPFVKIKIKDNGIGFNGDAAEKVFHIFQRLHRKEEYEGTGIGLALCKKIARNHGGDINAAGSSESGAVFNILLPLTQN